VDCRAVTFLRILTVGFEVMGILLKPICRVGISREARIWLTLVFTLVFSFGGRFVINERNEATFRRDIFVA